MEIITSLQNNKIKQTIKLKDGKERKKTGQILVEGRKEISLALASGVKLNTLFYCSELAGEEDEEILMLINQKNIFQVSMDVFKKMAYREHPDGLLAVAQVKPLALSEIKLSENPLVIILESLEKPGNIGAILRSAESAGADAVIITESKTDIYNPNVIRSSLGTIFSNQIALTTNQELTNWLKKNKIKTVAAHPHADIAYTKADLSKNIAIIIGTEDLGLSEYWLTNADEKIIIPMKGKIDSLNASASLAIILFEAIRQRN